MPRSLFGGERERDAAGDGAREARGTKRGREDGDGDEDEKENDASGRGRSTDAARVKRARREEDDAAAAAVLATPRHAMRRMMSDCTDDVPVARPAPHEAPTSDAADAADDGHHHQDGVNDRGEDGREDAGALPLDGVTAWHARWCLRGATVVVRAGGVGMRVHQAVLARYSEVWRDLGALPAFASEGEGTAGRETAGGLPVVDVTESAEAWDDILTALYHPEALSAQARVPWRTVTVLLEASRKYVCLPLRAAAIHHLSRLYPTSLAGWHRRAQLSDAGARAPAGLHAGALRLAREYEIAEILPAVYYMLSMEDEARLWDGWELGGAGAAGGRVVLPQGEVRTVLKGLGAIRRARQDAIFDFVRGAGVEADGTVRWRASGRCAGLALRGYRCGHFLARLAHEWEGEAAGEEGVYRRGDGARHDALKVLGRGARRVVGQYLCGSCRGMFKRQMMQGQRRVWFRLPVVFGLGTWFDIEERVRRQRDDMFDWFVRQEREREEGAGAGGDE